MKTDIGSMVTLLQRSIYLACWRVDGADFLGYNMASNGMVDLFTMLLQCKFEYSIILLMKYKLQLRI